MFQPEHSQAGFSCQPHDFQMMDRLGLNMNIRLLPLSNVVFTVPR
jgi:hypothetical protein